MKTDKVIIKKSNIHGMGIFADKDFKKGDVVLHWDTSQILTEEEFEDMSEDEKRYVTFCNGKYTKMQSPEGYMNSSCVANTNEKNFCDIAIRDIKKGEEITTQGKIKKCNCGNC